MRVRKTHIFLFVVFGLGLGALIFSFFFRNTDTVLSYKTLKLTIHDTPYTVALAETNAQREHGLSDTEHLPYDGMLFVFDTPKKYSFWMKDMQYPLDFLWLDSEKKIVSVNEGVSPDTYPEMITPSQPVLYVLEVSSGFIKRNSITQGDTVSW